MQCFWFVVCLKWCYEDHIKRERVTLLNKNNKMETNWSVLIAIHLNTFMALTFYFGVLVFSPFLKKCHYTEIKTTFFGGAMSVNSKWMSQQLLSLKNILFGKKDMKSLFSWINKMKMSLWSKLLLYMMHIHRNWRQINFYWISSNA